MDPCRHSIRHLSDNRTLQRVSRVLCQESFGVEVGRDPGDAEPNLPAGKSVSRNIPAFLKLVADEVDWKLCCPTSWPISGLRRNPAKVGDFFAAVASFDDLTVFEPKEFIEAR
jgi:hypothetical protein